MAKAKSTKSANTKAVAKKQEAGLPAELMNTGYTGFENVTNEDLSVPFLKIAQTMTPQVDEDDPSYIDGLKVGHLFNNLSGMGYGNKLNVVILGQYRIFIEWLPDRGGFVRAMTKHEFDDEKENFQNIEGKWYNGENEITDTRNLIVLLPDHLEDGLVIFPFSSSGITHFRRWLTMANGTIHPQTKKKAPIFSVIWEIETVKNENDKGKWYQIGSKNGTNIKKVDFVTDPELTAAVVAAIPVTQSYIEQSTKINYAAGEDTLDNEEETDF